MHFWDEHKTITRYYEMKMAGVCEKYNLRQMEYDILMFLYNNPKYNTAADIVRIRKSTKSHVSTSLKVLEDRGLIERRVDPANKKRVTLHLLQLANEVIEDGKWAQKVYDNAERMISIEKMPDLMEAIFDACYLIFDLIAGILFFVYSKGNPLFILYGVLTLTLCGGDAFHLVPRIKRAVYGTNDKIKRQLGIGLQVSSITMTVFYIILLFIWKLTFPTLTAPAWIEAMIWISAIIRIVVCFLPQNNWTSEEGNRKLSLIRNAVFAVTGIGVILLYAISGNMYDLHLNRMVAAIIISFGCYIPVTLWSKKKPMIGLLMIPKTCAYMWVIVMGLQLLF